MKSLKTKVHFVQILLTALAATTGILATLFAPENITFTTGSWGFINTTETQVPFFFGVISVFHLLGFLSFIFIYLSFEFYGFKNAFYTLINIVIVMCATESIMIFIKHLNETSPNIFFDANHIQLLPLSQRDFGIQTLAYAAGLTTTLLIATFLQKLSRDYFMFFRYTLASIIGFAVLIFLEFGLTQGRFQFDDVGLATAATPAAQYFALILAFIVPLYILRLFLGIFRGRPEKITTRVTPPEVTETPHTPETVPQAERDLKL